MRVNFSGTPLSSIKYHYYLHGESQQIYNFKYEYYWLL